jgi:hypothetical protein
MAEFITIYATKKENIDKSFIRGDILIVKMKKLYIVDKYGCLNYICTRKDKNKFVVSDTLLKITLGKFWYKYKTKYQNIGLIQN